MSNRVPFFTYALNIRDPQTGEIQNNKIYTESVVTSNLYNALAKYNHTYLLGDHKNADNLPCSYAEEGEILPVIDSIDGIKNNSCLPEKIVLKFYEPHLNPDGIPDIAKVVSVGDKNYPNGFYIVTGKDGIASITIAYRNSAGQKREMKLAFGMATATPNKAHNGGYVPDSITDAEIKKIKDAASFPNFENIRNY